MHFIPAALCLLFMLPFFRLTAEEKYYVIDHEGAGFELFLQLRTIAIILSGIVYVALTLFLINKHQKRIRDTFSDIEKINLRWLQYLTAGISLIWVAVIFGTEETTFALVVVFVLFIGIYGIRQIPIFAHAPTTQQDGMMVKPPDEHTATLETTEAEPIHSEIRKYRKSGLSEADLDQIHMQLNVLMEREKLFSQPDISLNEVARKLDIHPNYLSQVINTRMQKNFYDYINAQRIEEFLHLVADPAQQQYTLLALAFQCGFNSKSSFNRNFKKATGESPSEYLNRTHINLRDTPEH